MAKVKYEITGIKQAQATLAKATSGIKANTADGVAMAGQFIKGEAQSLTSIDQGDLIKTAFAVAVGKDGLTQIVGYTAEYAGAVHEMPSNTRWNRPGAENEFLLKAVIRNLTNITNIIARFSGKSDGVK